MQLVLFAVAVGLYLTAAAGFVVDLVLLRDVPRRFALAILGAGFAVHAAAILLRAVDIGRLPFGSLHDQLSLLGWLIVGTYLVLQTRHRFAVLGVLVSPLAFLLTLSAYLVYSGVRELPRHLQNAWLPAHVAPAFLGYAIFAMAFFISIVYLVQERRLKAKRRGAMFGRIPSLEALDHLNFRFVAWGFALFTVGIVTGSFLAKAAWGTFWSWEPVQVLSAISWLLYAALLQARSVGWRGRRAARLTIVGFVLLVATFIGLSFGRHSGTVS